MNMKKMVSLTLAGVMALSLMACTAQSGSASSENTSPTKPRPPRL